MKRMVLWLALVATAAMGNADFELPGLDGQTHRLSDYRGEWVVINYWATWCKPCRKEIPDLSRLHDEHAGITVLGLAFEDTDAEDFERFLEKFPASYPILLVDVYEPPATFGSPRALPTTHLVNADGEHVETWIGPVTGEMIAERINELE